MQAGKDLVLVTGATGRQGGAVARELLAKGHKVRALTRRPDGAEARNLARLGAEVVAGDLDDTASLERGVTGAWGFSRYRTPGRPGSNVRRSRVSV